MLFSQKIQLTQYQNCYSYIYPMHAPLLHLFIEGLQILK